MSAPFPSDLTAAPKGGAVAWVLNENGARNVWIAEAPSYTGRRLTNFHDDDGQEIAQLTWTPDGRTLLFVRGGDFEFGRDNPNPASLPQGVEQAIWIATPGESPRKVTEGSDPAVSPARPLLVFLRKDEIWSISLENGAKPSQLIHIKGTSRRSALVARRLQARLGLHARRSFFYRRLQLHRSIHRLSRPQRRPRLRARLVARQQADRFHSHPRRASVSPALTAARRRPGPFASPMPNPATAASSGTLPTGRAASSTAWTADSQLFWGAGDRIVFPWERTGWLHLYSISTHGDVPKPLNSAGEFEIEDASLSSDHRTVIFSSNENDIDRRHLWRVSVLGDNSTEITPPTPRLPASNGRRSKPPMAPPSPCFRSDARNPARAAIKIGSCRSPRPRSGFHSRRLPRLRSRDSPASHSFLRRRPAPPRPAFSSSRSQAPTSSTPPWSSSTEARAARCCWAGITWTTTTIPTR